MRRRECVLVLLVLILSVSLVVTLSVLLLERSVVAQSTDTVGILNAEEIRIVDKDGRARIRLAMDSGVSSIEILDQTGEVVWKAPPDEWIAGGISPVAEFYAELGGNHWVQTVLEQGRLLILEDGSRWEVEPLDQTETVLWAPTSPITVTEADSPVGDFRYLLTNTEEEKSVAAKFRGQR